MLLRPSSLMGSRSRPRPVLDVRFDAGQTIAGDARFSFSRASTAGYLDSDGAWKTAAIDVPRYITGQGILIEGACTNYLVWARDFTATGTWVRTNCTAALNQIGIDGAANSASAITATSDNATVIRTYTSGYSTWCYSVYLKRLSGTGKVYITHDGGTTWTEVAITSSWQRFWVYRTGTNPACGIKIETSGDVIAVDGAQNEVIGTTKSSSPTSVVFTAGSTLTRAADILTMNPAGWMDFTQGCILTKHIVQVCGNTYPILLSMSDGTASNYINIGNFEYTGPRLTATVYVGGVSKANTSSANYQSPIGSEARMAVSWRAGRFSHAHNGSLHATYGIRTPDSMPTPTQIQFGCKGDGTYRGSFVIGRIAYWNKPLDEDLMKRMTQA